MKQVSKSHYDFSNYEHKGRFSSYWHQIDEILKTNPSDVLEVGVGSGFLNSYFKLNFSNINMYSVDTDSELNPNYIGSIEDLSFIDNTFDTVVCFQVLEHLERNKFTKCLNELSKVSKKQIIISIPDRTKCIGFKVYLYAFFGKEIQRIFSIPFLSKKHVFDGEHYWEIGKKGYPLKSIISDIKATNLRIIRTYRVFEKPMHRFFVLSKN